MSRTRLKTSEFVRYGTAVVAGLLLTAAFPRPSIAGLAWLVPAMMLLAGLGCGGGQAFRVGYVAGLVHYLTSLYWLLYMPVNAIRVLGWAALSAYLALYIGVWVWLCWKMLSLEDRRGKRTFGRSFDGFATLGWFPRLSWAVACAAIWVALEMVRARLFTGFPWNPLGVSQSQVLPLIQISAITGVYGVSFLVAWFSASIISAVAVLMRGRKPGLAWIRELMVPLLVLVIVVSGGSRRLFKSADPGKTVALALVQPSFPQTMIWDEREDRARFERLLRLTGQALTNRPDILIWPESAVPGWFRLDASVRLPVAEMIRTNNVWVMLEAEDAEWREGPKDDPQSYDYYNSSFLMNPKGEIVGDYRKRRLVIFGEYIPLVRWLPFMKYLTPIGSGFTSGKRAVTFDMKELGVKTSALICFEDVFPHLTPECVEPETDFLVNLTNDGWFSRSAAQWQHAANAAFRAVENGLPLVRCTNNGLTCWVDAYGRTRGLFRDAAGTVYGEGFLITRVPVLGGARRETTFYGLHGDWFGWGCASCSLLALGLGVFGRRVI